MERHPARLVILWPIWKIEGSRSILHAMDDGLVVHQQPDGRFALHHYPMYRLVSRGRNSALNTLVRIASALDGGYRLVIVDKARFLPELIDLAKARNSQNARNDIDCALQAID